MAGGYIKLYRSVRGTAIADNPEYFAAWIHLLLMATHTEHDQVVGRQVVKLMPGQLVFGRDKFSATTGLSVNKVRAALKVMESLKMITIKSTTKYSVISITKWLSYQPQSPTDDQQIASKSPTDDHKQEGIKKGSKRDQDKDLSPAGPDDSQAIGRAKAIQMMELFNQVKKEKGTNWVGISDPGLTSDVRYKTAIARAKHVHKRLERKGKPNDWDSVMAWFKTLYEAWADDLFYSGHKETQQHPNGYRRSFESLHAQAAFIESLDRMVEK